MTSLVKSVDNGGIPLYWPFQLQARQSVVRSSSIMHARRFAGLRGLCYAVAVAKLSPSMIGIRQAIAAILSIIVLTACGAADKTLPCEQDPRCLSYGMAGEIPILDPHIAEAPEAGIVFRQIYDTLVYRNPQTHEFEPGLALDWEVSRDGLEYTFNLRPGVVFHDGTPMDAAAVGANIERIYDANINSQRARGSLGPLSYYETLDRYRIRFRLATPFAPFLDSLAQPFLGIASPQALESYDALRYQFHQIGTGPFVLENYTPGERIELRRNANYAAVNPAYEPLAGDEVDRIVFLIFDDAAGEIDAQLAGKIDVIDEAPPGDAVELAANTRLQLLPIPIPGQSVQLQFNTANEPVRERDVRLALLYATNRAEIVNSIFRSYSPVAWAPLSISSGYAHTGYINEYVYDLGLAQELLALAGYVDDDQDGILERDGQTLTVSVLVPPWGEWPAIASYLRRQWRRIGVNVEVAPVPGRIGLMNAIRSGEHDLIATDSFGLDPAILGNTYLGNTAAVQSGEDSAPLQDLLAAALQEQDPLARRTLYYEFQTQVMSEALILPIRDYVRLRVTRSNIRGLTFDAYGFYPLLYNVSLETE